MTQRPPRQSDRPHDESDRRIPILPTDSEQDERIDAAIRRLFAPPTTWPSLFNGASPQDHSAHNGHMAAGSNGKIEWRIDRPADRRTERHELTHETESRTDPARHDRTPRATWLRGMGVAACLLLGLFGVWSTWNHLAWMQLRSYQPLPMIEVGQVYQQFVEDGLQPTNAPTIDAKGHLQWMIEGTPITIRLIDAVALGVDIELLGMYRYDDLPAESPMLLMRVEDQPVVLFAGSNRFRYSAAAAGACSENLHVHGCRIGKYDVYELTPHASPSVLSFIERDGLACEIHRHPQQQQHRRCVIDTTP